MEPDMNTLICAQQRPLQFLSGQTMGEYATILLVVAIVAYTGYLAFGVKVLALVSSVNAVF
jgi:hypothetical protein